MKADRIQVLVDARWPACPIASTRQLAATALDDRVLSAAVRSGIVVRLRRGAYVRRAYWNGLEPWDRDNVLIQADFESTCGLSCSGHVSAARLHECRVWGVGPLILVTTGYANSSKSAGTDVQTHRVDMPSSKRATRRLSAASADFAAPASRVVIEFDGSGKYTDYKPTDEVLLAERRRGNALVEAGWVVLRLEWKLLASPAEMRRRLLATMDQARVLPPGADTQKRPWPA
ncbi:type IV toxin-antitoxin system AbiEi family antitoxin domain-containing protein [Arthrobacter sp. UYCo732]|uniref:type IV toxin-antitoxin system AbiEi family antitoxin domain-containing protein n=1 Tax=Arthrobacter sp. UYCo732 TaxID=3156336 RepID=UPI003397C1C6